MKTAFHRWRHELRIGNPTILIHTLQLLILTAIFIAVVVK